MKISILTEGDSEFKSLPHLFPAIGRGLKRSKLVKILKINASPDSPPAQFAVACRAPILVAARISQLAILVIDRETTNGCPGEIATELESALAKQNHSIDVRVCLKDRTYENWLIADLAALRAQPARFNVTPSVERLVQPDKADRCDALAALKRITKSSGQYDKVRDSDRIMQRASIDSISEHSRSFRHFLHVVGYEPYGSQCKLPKGRGT